MATKSRRLREWSYPILYPGSATTRVLIVGDSHASNLNNGAAEQRYEYGIARNFPTRFTGFFSFNGSWLCQSINSGAGSLLAVGTTQHPDDGCIAPHECVRYAYGAGVATDTLIHRLPYAAATLAQTYGGNRFANQACVSRIAWWARATSLQTCRCRSYDSTFGTNTEDVTLDMRSAGTGVGTGNYRYRDFNHTADADAPLWDCLTGAEDETSRELTFIGSRFQLADPSGGVVLASIGNGGRTAADYVSTSTIADNDAWDWFIETFGPFHRIKIVLGTNMSAGEAAAITTVWRDNMLAFAERLLARNDWANGPADAMVLLTTGHDANITARLPDMATAIDSCSSANPRIAHYDLAADLVPYATLNSTYLADGVHFNAAGADYVAQKLAAAMVSSIGGSGGLRNPRATDGGRLWTRGR